MKASDVKAWLDLRRVEDPDLREELLDFVLRLDRAAYEPLKEEEPAPGG